MIEGPPGIGKSRLLAYAAERAMAGGIRALTTVGSDLESGIPFGIVQHLFIRLVGDLSPDQRDHIHDGAAQPASMLFRGAAGEPIDTAAMCNAIYWLTSNLAEAGPLALLIDDAQYGDAASLTALVHLGRRIQELPVALLVAARLEPRPAELQTLARTSQEAGNALLRPAALSADGVASLLEARLGRRPATDAAEAALAATEGNPYLLGALARALGDAIAGEDGARAVRELGPEAIGRATLNRIETHEQWAVARAVAVFGDGCEVRHATGLSGLDSRQVEAAADALAAAEVTSPGFPLGFLHPTIGEAVVAGTPAGARSTLHAAAARLLEDEGAPPERVAVHLLATEPASDPERVGRLRQAAGVAISRGAPAAAAGFLRRALDEPPPEKHRAAVLGELGLTEARSGDPAGIEHLREAHALSTGAPARSRAAMVLGKALSQAGRTDEASEVFGRARDELGDTDPDYGARLASGALLAGLLHRRRSPGLERALDAMRNRAEMPRDLEVAGLGTLAWNEAMAGSSATTTRELAIRSLSGGITTSVLDGALFLAITALISTDAYEEAAAFIEEATDVARASGMTGPYSMACAVATYLHFRWGRLSEAIAAGENAVEIDRHAGLPWGMPVAPGWLAHALVEHGDLDEAEALIVRHDLDSLAENPAYDIVRHARGTLHAARGDLERARADFLAAGQGQSTLGAVNPSLLPWRSSAALACHRLGALEEADRLAADEVELATRYGAPRALGIALCARGVVLGGDEGLALLRRSSEVLDGIDALHARATALVATGTALRRAGLEREAREPLREGMHLASAAGAAPLAERARDELVAAGGRPRRMALEGPDALTPSEARIARLAAGGRTNRVIAQDLFLSVKTVEFHLRNAYRKLDISSRGGLAEALAGPGNRA